ncbi:MAG: RNA polymerase sigma factor [Armatimonadetes bacterium]|nr:hypothetical protein [Armatimonadota bacterium]MBS1700585.1 RNA polymerase sigma factor [Armatimonadota bacterium]MBS1728930.1 RNA polymerase sigma factor [Armatimonadota bacterium]
MDQLTNFDFERMIEKAKSGDIDALYSLFAKAHVAALAIAVSVVKNRTEAEDVIQDAFHKILRNIDSASTIWPKFRSWMLMIVKNEAIDHSRKLKRLVPIEEWVEIPDGEQARQEETDRVDEQAFELVQQYRSKLMPRLKRQQPIILREIAVRVDKGVEFKEACNSVSRLVVNNRKSCLSPGAVQAEWFRVFRMLKQILEEDKVRLEAAKPLMILIGKGL